MASPSPKISIITASYNQGHYIEETIRSIIDQGYPNLEYIIMDGGSSDQSVSIISKYESKISYWISEKDKGQSDAINKGFQRFSGDVVNWLNSDDYYEPGSLMHVANQFSDPKTNCYIGISRIFGGERIYFSTGTDLYEGNFYKTIGWARIDQPETFFSGAVIRAIGPLNRNLHFVMDKDLWIRYLCKYGLEGIKKDQRLIAHFRLHGESKTVSLAKQFEEETCNLFYTYAKHFGIESYCVIFERLWNVSEIPLEYWPESPGKEAWESILNYFLLQKAFIAYAQNDYEKAQDLFRYIDLKNIDPADRKEAKNIKIRMRLLPMPLKKIINRLSR